jgi:hypothetical protein
MTSDGVIVSRAHEVCEALPVWSGVYVCMRCGLRGSLDDLFSPDPSKRCVPHFVLRSSGWFPESPTQERQP